MYLMKTDAKVRWAQPDGLILNPSNMTIMIVEIKLEAYWRGRIIRLRTFMRRSSNLCLGGSCARLKWLSGTMVRNTSQSEFNFDRRFKFAAAEWLESTYGTVNLCGRGCRACVAFAMAFGQIFPKTLAASESTVPSRDEPFDAGSVEPTFASEVFRGSAKTTPGWAPCIALCYAVGNTGMAAGLSRRIRFGRCVGLRNRSNSDTLLQQTFKPGVPSGLTSGSRSSTSVWDFV